MNDSPDEPPLSKRFGSWRPARDHSTNFNSSEKPDDFKPRSTLINPPGPGQDDLTYPTTTRTATGHANVASNSGQVEGSKEATVADDRIPTVPPPAPPPMVEERDGEESAPMNSKEKAPVRIRFLHDCKRIIFSSWINWLLIFVPAGIVLGAVERTQGEVSPIQPTVVFSINAIAIIPLASLLAFATESVATKMGDTIGALLNVTFGNAVELIVFIIALVANEIQIVQAAALGSILSNLLLILGMSFLFGGLRFREQLYNSNISQMSACLLSLSVVSLLLPTAFHASFSNGDVADRVVLKVSRGTSVVLLFVYVLYLLFQLKSHAYMYESTPQHLIDEESHPGVLAEMLNSSSSSESSSSSSDTDSDTSSGSRTTAKRIKRALRRKRRKSSDSSKDLASRPSTLQIATSAGTTLGNDTPGMQSPRQISRQASNSFEAVVSGDEADVEKRSKKTRRSSTGVSSKDFGNIRNVSSEETVGMGKKSRGKFRRAKRTKAKAKRDKSEDIEESIEKPPQESQTGPGLTANRDSSPQVNFTAEVQEIPSTNANPKRPFSFRDLSRTAIPRNLSPAIFASQGIVPSSSVPGRLSVPRGSPIRRTTSMPEMGNSTTPVLRVPFTSAQPLPHLMPSNQHIQAVVDPKDSHRKEPLSRTSAILLLLCVTALVATCAEFLVHSIDYMVEETGVSQAFIGLIILPIVGNAAEHVTAVTVASKNKMDLAIGVALGSSIQIAIFVTPLIVLLGWCLDRDMSLYFSLFETISLFASTFIVNYLMIDGRSNYLEGALLIAAYVIIALAAFFYPSCENLSEAGGLAESSCRGR